MLIGHEEDHRSEIARSHAIDDAPRHLASDLDRLGIVGNGQIIEEDDEQPLLEYLVIAPDVGRDVAHPRRRRLDRNRDVDRAERLKALRQAVLEHGEVGGRKPAHRLPAAIQYGDVELDQIDAGAELRDLGRRHGPGFGGGHQHTHGRDRDGDRVAAGRQTDSRASHQFMALNVHLRAA